MQESDGNNISTPRLKTLYVIWTKIGRSGIAEILYHLEGSYMKELNTNDKVNKLSITDLNVRSIFVIRIVNSSIAECLWHLEPRAQKGGGG